MAEIGHQVNGVIVAGVKRVQKALLLLCNPDTEGRGLEEHGNEWRRRTKHEGGFTLIRTRSTAVLRRCLRASCVRRLAPQAYHRR